MLILLIQRPHLDNLCLKLREGKRPSFVIPPTQILLPMFSQEAQLSLNTHLICCVHEMNEMQAFPSKCSQSRADSRRQNAMRNEKLYRVQWRRKRGFAWGQRMSKICTWKEDLGRRWGIWGTKAQKRVASPFSHLISFLFNLVSLSSAGADGSSWRFLHRPWGMWVPSPTALCPTLGLLRPIQETLRRNILPSPLLVSCSGDWKRLRELYNQWKLSPASQFWPACLCFEVWLLPFTILFLKCIKDV